MALLIEKYYYYFFKQSNTVNTIKICLSFHSILKQLNNFRILKAIFANLLSLIACDHSRLKPEKHYIQVLMSIKIEVKACKLIYGEYSGGS